MLVFENKNPTEAEKMLYYYAGYYLTYDDVITIDGRDTNIPYLVYTVCYTDNTQRDEFPTKITISEDKMDKDNKIIFDGMYETVRCSSLDLDRTIIDLISDRMSELGFG